MKPEIKEKLGTKQYHKAIVKKAKDLGEGILDVVVATDDVDRDLEVLDIKALDVKAFKENPVVLWGHKYGELPVGQALAIKKTQDGKLQARVKFALDEYDFAHTVYKLFKGGFLRAFSIGFIPKNLEYDEDTDVIKWTESEMLEFSAVTVPANANALALAFQKGVISDKEKKLFERTNKKLADGEELEDYTTDDQTNADDSTDDDGKTEQEVQSDTQPANTDPDEENGPQADWATDGDKPAGDPSDEKEEQREGNKDEDEAPKDGAVDSDDAETKKKSMTATVNDLEQYTSHTVDFIRKAMDSMEKLLKENFKDSGQGRAAVQKRRVRLVKARGILQLVDKAGEGLNREIKSSVIPRRKVKLVTKKENHA